MNSLHRAAGVAFVLYVVTSFPLSLVAQTLPSSRNSLTDQLLDDGPPRPAADPPPGRPDATSVSEQMEHVGRRLRLGLLDTRTRALQEAIAQQLEALLENSAQRSSSARQSSAAPSRSDEPPQQSATAGTERPGLGAETRQPEETGLFRQRSLNVIWGHLPATLQEQIRSPLHDDFLPGYRQRISDYYQRLSEPQ